MKPACLTAAVALALTAALALAAPPVTPDGGSPEGGVPKAGTREERLRLLREVVSVLEERAAVEIPRHDILYAAVRGMLRALDPYSIFLEPAAFEEMRSKQDRQFFGIGAVVGMRNGQLTLIHPIKGSPAEEAGLAPGDVIQAIDGELTSGMDQEQAVRRLKGPQGSVVKLAVARRGVGRGLSFAVERNEITEMSVRNVYMLEPGTGYVEVTQFNRGTAAAVTDALFALERQGMERLVLDLRNNSGGLLDQAIEVANLFVPEGGVILKTHGRGPTATETFEALGRYNKVIVPLVVLVNQGTASAAEILAGAIQDHDLGLLVGSPTWGKGLVQTVYALSDGSGLILTTTSYYTPSGRLIQREDRLGNMEMDREMEGRISPDRVFLTDLGRKVYGGGGIVPDIPAHGKELSPFDLDLLNASAYLQFAVDYHQRHPGLTRDWDPGEETLAAFREWLLAEGVISRRELDAGLADEDTRRFALREIRAELFNVAFGAQAAHQVRTASDRQVRIALDHFHRAVEMQERRRARYPDHPPESHHGAGSEAGEAHRGAVAGSGLPAH